MYKILIDRCDVIRFSGDGAGHAGCPGKWPDRGVQVNGYIDTADRMVSGSLWPLHDFLGEMILI